MMAEFKIVMATHPHLEVVLIIIVLEMGYQQ